MKSAVAIDLKSPHDAVEDALYRLDVETRREYDAALEIVPELVRREANLQDFWNLEGGNATKAALRVARYWKARKEFFGERWLLPLNQTGHGALTMTDIEMLRTGFMVTLPRPSGGVVTLYDLGKCWNVPGQPDLPTIKDICMRCVFYTAHVYGFSMHQCTILHVITGEPRPGVELSPRLWNILSTAMPIRFVNVLVAQAHVQGKEDLIDYMAYQEQRATEYKSQRKLNRIEGHSVKQTLRQLQAQGLEAECLPRCLGGQYDYKNYSQWVRVRCSVEDMMSAAPVRYRPCSVPQVTQIANVSKRGTLARVSDDLTRRKNQVASKADLERERNALYSRRSFNKRKLEKLALENQRDLLRMRNAHLQQENNALQQALQQAQRVIGQYQQGSATTTTTAAAAAAAAGGGGRNNELLDLTSFS